MSPHIRQASEQDIAGITAIYNDAVAHTTAIWNNTIVDTDNRRLWLAERKAQGFPVLVATADDAVLGYATYGPFRPHEGYRHTVENSVYVRTGSHGQGIATSLMRELIAMAQAQNIHVMVAGIEAGNEASYALHSRLGFTEAARLSQVGRKFDRWLDLVLMQKML